MNLSHIQISTTTSIENNVHYCEENNLKNLFKVNLDVYRQVIAFIKKARPAIKILPTIKKQYVIIRLGRDSYCDDVITWINKDELFLILN